MNFWDSQSVLSGDGDLSSLSLVRWRREVEWSPWNCLLVNEEEKEIHAEVDDLTAVNIFSMLLSVLYSDTVRVPKFVVSLGLRPHAHSEDPAQAHLSPKPLFQAVHHG